MDIAALSTAMSMQQLHLNVSYAMMSKVMDTMEMTGEAMEEMLDSAAQIASGSVIPGLGENIDILV